jgi:F-type H+-transporting ATPase subunit delta
LRNTVLARRYAKALFELAVEKSMLAQIHGELNEFSDLLEAQGPLRLVFYAQDISTHQKTEAVAQLLSGKVSSTMLNFLRVLLAKGRATVWPTVVVEFGHLVDRHEKRIQAIATTAVAMEKELHSRLKAGLDQAFGADVAIANQVDSGILGGLIVQVGGQVLDGSLRSQLQRLKQSLVSSSVESTQTFQNRPSENNS